MFEQERKVVNYVDDKTMAVWAFLGTVLWPVMEGLLFVIGIIGMWGFVAFVLDAVVATVGDFNLPTVFGVIAADPVMLLASGGLTAWITAKLTRRQGATTSEADFVPLHEIGEEE